jgi:hypothetical protein
LSGAIEEIKNPEEEDADSPQIISRIFTVPKKSGGYRPCLNLRPLNAYCKYAKFKMEGLKTVRDLIRQNDHMVSIDLKDAYHHVPIKESARPYFRFRWEEKIYQCNAMPFGWSEAPRLFTQIMKMVVKTAREAGIRIVIYLDDMLIMSESKEHCIKDRDIVLSILDRLGLTVSIKKSKLDPSQRMEFLGTIIDSIRMVFEVPIEKLRRYQGYVSSLLIKIEKGKPLSLNGIRSIIGCLGSMSECIPAARLHLNHLLRAAIAAERQPSKLLLIPPKAQEELKWWQMNCCSCNGKPIHTPSPHHCFDTDASHHGWGGVYLDKDQKRHEAHGRFQSKLTSNERELRAVLHTTQAFTKQLKWNNCVIRVRTDNIVTMTYVNKMGGKLPHLLALTELLHTFCLKRGIVLTAEYLPGVKNIEADRLSRIENDMSESKLNPHLFNTIQERWGPLQVDCFASSTNHQLKKYISLRTDHTCMYPDFFSRPAPPLNLYAYPPYPIIGKMLRKVREEKLTLTAVLPVWPSHAWWPVAMELVVDWPLLLPPSLPLLELSEEGVTTQMTPKWRSVALQLSGDNCKRKAFLPKLSHYSSIATKGELSQRKELYELMNDSSSYGTHIAENISTTLSIYRGMLSQMS